MQFLLHSLTLALGLAAVSAFAAEPARRGPQNPDEPWLFRTVLDDRPRVAVAALGDALWAAWDTQSCRLYQVWQPGALGVKLTGAVFDGKHGPQPMTDGTMLLREPAGAAWLSDGKSASVRYRGHRLGAPGEVTFLYEIMLPGAVVSVEESPRLDGTKLTRTFHIAGLPEGKALTLALTDAAWSSSGTTALEGSADGARLIFSANGSSTLSHTWDSSK